MNRRDILVITHAAAGEGAEYGIDDVSPAQWHIGIITSITKDGAPRAWRDVNGATHRIRVRDVYRYVARDSTPLYLNPDGVMAQLQLDHPTGVFARLVDAKEWLRDVRHSAYHRAAVIRAAGF